MQKVRYQEKIPPIWLWAPDFKTQHSLSLTVLYSLSINLSILAFEKVFESSVKLIVVRPTHNTFKGYCLTGLWIPSLDFKQTFQSTSNIIRGQNIAFARHVLTMCSIDLLSSGYLDDSVHPVYCLKGNLFKGGFP